MSREWVRFCKGDDITVRGQTIVVQLADGRAHSLEVLEEDGAFRLVGTAARRGALSGMKDPDLFVWERNRSTNLVGFRIDKHDRLIGESWVPRCGLTGAEFLIFVRTLAAECDRLEALITGADEV